MTGERDPNGVLFVHEFDSDGRIVGESGVTRKRGDNYNL